MNAATRVVYQEQCEFLVYANASYLVYSRGSLNSLAERYPAPAHLTTTKYSQGPSALRFTVSVLPRM
jgi:hypothetical protein